MLHELWRLSMVLYSYNSILYKDVSKKLNRAREYINLPRIELIKRDHIYILAEGYPLAKAFLYSCYLLAM
jgi:hypothetical protein